jgi:hypothetical protein
MAGDEEDQSLEAIFGSLGIVAELGSMRSGPSRMRDLLPACVRWVQAFEIDQIDDGITLTVLNVQMTERLSLGEGIIGEVTMDVVLEPTESPSDASFDRKRNLAK